MFASLRRHTILRQAARIHTSSLSTSFPSSAVRLAVPKPGAVVGSVSKVVSSIPSSTRFFSIYSRNFSAVQAAVQEFAEDAFDTPKSDGKGKVPELVKFQDLIDHNLIDKRVMKSIIQDMRFENMTEVQSKTLRACLEGTDVLAQARTGTGKTIAFLLPVLQRILTAKKPIEHHRTGRPLDIRSIIISPTRELAQQIAKEAEVLTRYVPHIQIHTAVGGTGKVHSLRAMNRNGCNILIATPGRLYDLLTDKTSNVTGNNMEILVLDEADNLLDQGFADALMDIIKLLPPKTSRQTLLFSATVPDKVQKMVSATLSPNHQFLKMVPKGEVLTHNKVEQRLLTVKNFENLLPTLYETMQKEIATTLETEAKPFKAIVFFPTAKYASLAAQTFNSLRDPETQMNPFGNTSLIEIHSRLNQSQRERAAAKFRQGRSAVLFSSDVVARGMDFPDVTHVFQVGSPRSLEQYIHRIGRTGRGSNSGLGYILLTDLEKETAMKELRTIKLIPYNEHSAIANLDMSRESVLPKSAAEALTRVMEASQSLDSDLKKGAYLANLGYYCYLGDKKALVQSLNRWTMLGWGMQQPPRISSMLVQRLGLQRIPGLEIGSDERSGGFSRGGDREGDREGGFRPREGGFAPRGDREGGFKPREGGFAPRGDREGGFKPRDGGFAPRGDREGGFAPRGDREGGFKPRDGGFAPRGDREGGFRPRDGGFAPRGDREGGFRSRDGGFAPRGDREGGFKPREGGFAPRGDREGGFKPREGGFAPREGGFKPRDGGFPPRGDRDGGFKPRESRGSGFQSTGAERRPWDVRGKQSPGKRFN